nr:MAG TPA: hypothetical protein [Caudoviricetes sp.]
MYFFCSVTVQHFYYLLDGFFLFCIKHHLLPLLPSPPSAIICITERR